MRDGPIRRVVKRVALWNFRLNVGATRLVLRLRGEPGHRLGGECRRCAKCCEEPTIQIGQLTRSLPPLRRLSIGWHRAINGFELVGEDPSGRTLAFRCTHFNRETRACDSYDSRPGMCRDYPRGLLRQANPQFFAECGHRPVARGADRMAQALEGEDLSPEQVEEIKRRLHLEE